MANGKQICPVQVPKLHKRQVDNKKKQGAVEATQPPAQPPTQQATQPKKQEPTQPKSHPHMHSTTKVPGVSTEQQEQGKQPKTQVKRKRGRLRKKSKIQEEAEKMVEEFFGPKEEIKKHTLLIEEDTHGGTYPQVPIQPLQQSGSGDAPVIAEQPSKPPRLPVKKR